MSDESLTQKISSIEKRLGAVESEASNPDGVSRITKLYGSLRVTVTLSTRRHTYRRCSESLLCGGVLLL